ncbi:MAG: hypothetical protein CVV10_03370 [Gammaproteobacteria bacterium HGW-Gammaproteobacteria-14]|nr:MAG: hypothetical protein CVV10_03370 [Gammaproteobacteria bacterium HGW-Gammaproteobacteria-14]
MLTLQSFDFFLWLTPRPESVLHRVMQSAGQLLVHAEYPAFQGPDADLNTGEGVEVAQKFVRQACNYRHKVTINGGHTHSI